MYSIIRSTTLALYHFVYFCFLCHKVKPYIPNSERKNVFTFTPGGLPGLKYSKCVPHTCFYDSTQWVVSFTKSMIIHFNNTVPLDERKYDWLNIKYIENEMAISSIWNHDTVFRVHFALTCKNYSPGYVFKRSWLQSESNIWSAHDHIKQHFNIPLQSSRARAPSAKTIILNIIINIS